MSPDLRPPEPDPGGVRRPRPTSSALPDRGHLRRLSNVWVANPLYFITCCTADRRPLLTAPSAAEAVTAAFRDSPRFHRWAVGRYVIMPDHVHFFAQAYADAKPLSEFLRDLKKWTARQLATIAHASTPIWQSEFFDHVLRSADSYSEKWDYVRHNPVRAGLCSTPDAWPHSGECEPLSF